MNQEVLLGLAFALVGIAGLATVSRDLSRAADSEDWPQVDGEVVESRITSWVGGYRIPLRSFSPLVRYQYHVGGKLHVSDRVAFAGPVLAPLRSLAQRTTETYRRGASVKVHVCPIDPALSVLEPGVHWLSYVEGLGMAAFLIGGVLLLHAGLP